MAISPRLVHHLLLDIVLQAADRHDIVVDLFMLTGDQEDGDLVQNDRAWRHQFHLERPDRHFLARLQVVLIDYFDGHVDRLTRLSELDSHLVNAINNAFSTL